MRWDERGPRGFVDRLLDRAFLTHYGMDWGLYGTGGYHDGVVQARLSEMANATYREELPALIEDLGNAGFVVTVGRGGGIPAAGQSTGSSPRAANSQRGAAGDGAGGADGPEPGSRSGTCAQIRRPEAEVHSRPLSGGLGRSQSLRRGDQYRLDRRGRGEGSHRGHGQATPTISGGRRNCGLTTPEGWRTRGVRCFGWIGSSSSSLRVFVSRRQRNQSEGARETGG